jgi:hypothetical protein
LEADGKAHSFGALGILAAGSDSDHRMEADKQVLGISQGLVQQMVLSYKSKGTMSCTGDIKYDDNCFIEVCLADLKSCDICHVMSRAKA